MEGIIYVQRWYTWRSLLELKKQIKQLKEALGQTQAENILNQEFLKIACEEMGQDIESFKKKAGTELFTRQDKPEV